MKLSFTNDADQDIQSILEYIISEFGLDQATKYYDGLEAKFSAIVEGRAHSQDYSFVREGLKRTNYQIHAIYFKVIGQDEVLVLHVLHQRMNQLLHIDKG